MVNVPSTRYESLAIAHRKVINGQMSIVFMQEINMQSNVMQRETSKADKSFSQIQMLCSVSSHVTVNVECKK